MSYLNMRPICISQLDNLFEFSGLWEIDNLFHLELYIFFILEYPNFHVIIKYVEGFFISLVNVGIILNILTIGLECCNPATCKLENFFFWDSLSFAVV